MDNLLKLIFFARIKEQEGTALIIALVMLAVMSLLGSLALTTTDSELAVTTNVRAANEAFLAADRAVVFAMSNGAIISDVGTDSVDLNGTPPSYTDSYADDIRAGKGRLDTNAVNEIQFLSAGGLPVGAESDPTYFEGRYYRIAATGAVDGHPAVSRVETQFVRIFPKMGM